MAVPSMPISPVPSPFFALSPWHECARRDLERIQGTSRGCGGAIRARLPRFLAEGHGTSIFGGQAAKADPNY